MGTFKELLEKQDVLILHGALGTELEALGYDISGKLWSASICWRNQVSSKTSMKPILRLGRIW